MTLILGIVVFIETVLLIGMFFYKRTPYSGTIKVLNAPLGKTFSLELNGDPEQLETMDEVKFKVVVPDRGQRDENIA